MSAAGWRGIGVEGTLGAERVAALAQEAEDLRYDSFWFNVTERAGDPFAMLRAAMARTAAIEIGIGVLPLDRFPPPALAAALRDAGALSRLVVGISSGRVRQGGMALVEAGIARLRDAVPAARIAVGTYGPRMLRLSGRKADAVLLNWMTPARLVWATGHMATAAGAAGRPMPRPYLYHRAARGPGGAALIEAEMAAYRHFPVHQRHQEAMGNPRLVGLAAATRDDVAAGLEPYAGFCWPILKPLAADPGDLAEWRSLFRFFAPG